jgi:putative nucleotidyltransferase with HDIG domain
VTEPPLPQPPSPQAAPPGPPGFGTTWRVRPGDVLRGVARARRTVALYGGDHPVTVKTITETFQVLDEMLSTRPLIRLFIHEDSFYIGRTVLLEESLRLGGLLAELVDRQIGMIEFHEGLEAWELQRLVEVLNLRPSELLRLGGATVALQQRDVRHVVASSARPMQAEERAEFRVDPRDVYRAGLRVIDDLYSQASHDLQIDLRKAGMIVNSLLEVMTEDRAALIGIAALRLYDENTAHHSVNVAVLSLLCGTELKLPRPLVMTLGLAALLHDVGKVRIARDLLLKNEPLTDEERDTVRRHTLYGAHLLRNLPGLSRLAMVVAFEHHANFNLSGYPRITVKSGPHLLTRIISVADFFDAATASTRPQRPMLPAEAVAFILRHAGTTFDPTVAHTFARVVGRYPVGSLVELSSGDLAVVVRPADRDTERPGVTVVADAARAPVTPHAVDLEDAPGLRIIRALDPIETGVDVSAHF